MAPADPPLRWGEPVAALAAGATRGWVRACSGAGSLAADAADAVDATSARSGAASRVATLVVPHDAAWGAVPTSLAVAVAPPAAPPPLHPPAPSPSAAAFYAGAAAALSRDGPRAALLLGGDALLLGGGLRAAAAIAAATGCALLCENGFAALDRGAGAPPVARVPYFPRDAVACLSAFATLVLVGAPPPAAMFGYPGEEGRAGAVCALPDEAVWDADGVAPVDALDALAAALGLRAPPPPAPPPQQPPHPPAPLLPDRACALTPALLCTVVAALQPPGCVVVDESLTSGGDYWRLSASAPGFTHLTLTGGAIGSGLPLSVGAALARPGARVLLLQADGSGLYAPQALWTQARERLGVVTLVCSNRRYGILRLEAAIQRTGPQGPAGRSLTDLSGPAIDWCALARGFGVPAADAVATVGELADALGAALAQPGPTLIEVALP